MFHKTVQDTFFKEANPFQDVFSLRYR